MKRRVYIATNSELSEKNKGKIAFKIGYTDGPIENRTDILNGISPQLSEKYGGNNILKSDWVIDIKDIRPAVEHFEDLLKKDLEIYKAVKLKNYTTRKGNKNVTCSEIYTVSCTFKSRYFIVRKGRLTFRHFFILKAFLHKKSLERKR